MVEKVIHKTFLPRMIPNIRHMFIGTMDLCLDSDAKKLDPYTLGLTVGMQAG